MLRLTCRWASQCCLLVWQHALAAGLCAQCLQCLVCIPGQAHLPPVHPVLTSQACVPCWAIFSASMDAYFMGCHMRKAPPKQALNVASGSVTPSSVPATCQEQTM